MKNAKPIAILALWIVAVFLVACGGGQPPGTSGNSNQSNSGTSTLSFQVTDSCDDGNTIYYRFFDETNNLQWPSPATDYYDATEGNTYTSNLQCNTGANICIGASEDPNTEPANTPYWGVGVDNAYKGLPTSSNTCSVCSATTYTLALTCPQSDSSSLGAAETDRQRRTAPARDLAPDRLGQER